MQGLYCKILVDTEMTESELLKLVCEITQGVKQGVRTVATSDYEADVLENDNFDRVRRSKGRDQFLYYRCYLDVFPTPQTLRANYVKAVGGLLEKLWRSGCKAVAACRFEDELPRNGGYNDPLPA